jgi:hypothetical protein
MPHILNTDKADPIRANERVEIEEPSCTKSITDKHNKEPNLPTPATDRLDPIRTKLRQEVEEPKVP